MIDHTNAPRGIELGHPGASARAEFEWRRRRDASAAPALRARPGGRGGAGRRDPSLHRPLACGGRGRGTRGPAAECGGRGRRCRAPRPGGARGQANIDHIAVLPSGVWVIDTKRYRRRVRRAGRLGRLVGRRLLVVNGHDRSHLLDAARRQWGPWARPFAVRGVTVTWPGALAAALVAPRRAEAATDPQ